MVMEAIMKREFESAPAADEMFTEEADVAIAAWTLDELDATELGSARWTTASDEQAR